jgi:ribosomal protein L37AE/L43A
MEIDFIKGCEVCGKNKISFKRADDIYVCDKCNKRYPIKDDK